MTDAHCHVASGETRHFLCGDAAFPDVAFYGVHPWDVAAIEPDAAKLRTWLEAKLDAHPRAGVGEIGLDRLKDREISPWMREAFRVQLAVAVERGLPVVLHGAKCWGQVVREIRSLLPTVPPFHHSTIPPFLFHGFSRSDGLIPDIVALNGYVSVGPAVLNDHAVNYRELVRKLPLDRLLVESDRTAENAAETPSVREIAVKVAELRGLPLENLLETLEINADNMIKSLLS